MDDISPASRASAHSHAKRNRVLLSCAPCRTSKLKCDRSEPCGQCLKKGRPGDCAYAPKTDKQRPTKSMAARLRRLEGMVRNIMDEDPEKTKPAATPSAVDDLGTAGQVVHGERATTYVGATHFMAILEDIDDLKSYFEEPEQPETGSPEHMDDLDAPELLIFTRGAPRSRDELLRILPERAIMDRLIMRYFASSSPSQHIIHRPTFVKEYAAFWHDPQAVDFHWLALLFMVMSLGVFFSTFTAPHELSGDSPEPPMDRFKFYRSAAAWCLVKGNYTLPSAATIPPFILYIEAEFLMSRAAQMSCYLLSSVGMRLMLKMGLHRDPSKLANLSPFEGEMRKRMWNMAIQLDLLVSFHLGLPSMINGIESDCTLPRNLLDEDFDENCTELPPARPMTDFTSMTYPINKSLICQVFGKIARQAHSLSPPSYSEVMKLDGSLKETWAQMPKFMMVRPLEDCVAESPVLITQRFGLAALYQKSRCVLHRRYLAEVIPRKEHKYSRGECLEAALNLLEYQNTIWHASQPGKMMSSIAWFMSSLAIHDYLLAGTILYLVIQSEHYSETGDENEWITQQISTPTKEELIRILRRSYNIWTLVAQNVPGTQKAAGILETMLSKVTTSRTTPQNENGASSQASSQYAAWTTTTATGSTNSDSQPLARLSINDEPDVYIKVPETPQGAGSFDPLQFASPGMPTTGFGLDSEWLAVGDEMDWRYFDNILYQSATDPNNLNPGESWLDRLPAPDDFGF